MSVSVPFETTRKSWIIIRNLASNVQVEPIKKSCESHGNISRLQIILDDDGSNWHAFVQYETTASALAAFQVLSENFEVTLESDLVNINNNLVVAATLLKNAARDSGHQVCQWNDKRTRECSFPPCSQPASIKCAICKSKYCSIKCQEDHWEIHMMVCRRVPRAVQLDGSPLSPECQPRLLRRPLLPSTPFKSNLFQTDVIHLTQRLEDSDMTHMASSSNPELTGQIGLKSVQDLSSFISEEKSFHTSSNLEISSLRQEVAKPDTTKISTVESKLKPIPGKIEQFTNRREVTAPVEVNVEIIRKSPSSVNSSFQSQSTNQEIIKISAMTRPFYHEGDVVSLWGVDLDKSANRLIITKQGAQQLQGVIGNILQSEARIPLNTLPQKDQVVACKWENDGDGQIYRAVVSSANAAMKKVKVQFLDFGNRSIEQFSAITVLPEVLTGPEFPCLASVLVLADVPEINLKVDQTANDRLKHFLVELLHVTQTLVVTKVQEFDGVKMFTLATPDGRSLNEGLKNCLLSNDPAALVLQKVADVQYNYNPSKILAEKAFQFGVAMTVNKLFAVSPLAIYVMQCDLMEQFEELLETFSSLMVDINPVKDFRPQVGSLCLAKSSDGEWYRAAILSQSPGGYLAFFPDFGFQEILPADRMAPISEELASLNFLPFKCVLEEFESLDQRGSVRLQDINFGDIFHFQSIFEIVPLRLTCDGSGVVISVLDLPEETASALRNLRLTVTKHDHPDDLELVKTKNKELEIAQLTGSSDHLEADKSYKLKMQLAEIELQMKALLAEMK